MLSRTSAALHALIHKSKKTQGAPIFNPIETRHVETYINNTNITRTNYKSFDNPSVKKRPKISINFQLMKVKKSLKLRKLAQSIQ